MKTREIELGPDFTPKATPATDTKASEPVTPSKNPFEELQKDKYTKTNPFFNKPVPEEPQLNVKKEEPEEEIPIARVSTELGEEWIRQDLPSKCIPYDFNDVFLRPIRVKTLGLIHAARINASFTLLLDALNYCVSVDIRELTPPDLTFVMHWIRENSYPKSPLKIRYKTRYGNDIEVPVKRHDLEITEFQMSAEDYKSWKDKGIVFPKVRDMELLFGDSVPVEQRYLLDYAQWTDVDIDEKDYDNYVAIKIDALDAKGLGFLSEIDEFKSLTEHGVEESVVIVDPKFNPQQAIHYFESQADQLIATITRIDPKRREEFADTIIDIESVALEMQAEADEIKEALEKGEKVVAKEEVVEVKLTATNFFPPV